MKTKKNTFFIPAINLKSIWIIFTFFLLIFTVNSTNINIPNNYYSLYVNDFANILNETDTKYLITLFDIVENQTTAEVVFVSIQTCSPLEPSQMAQEIGNTWKVGKKNIDNGLIILYCKAENKIWVATGYGLEGILPDSKIGRLLDEYYVPYRNLNQTSEGIVQTSIQLAKILDENKEEIIVYNENAQKIENQTITLYLIPTIIILIMLITQIIHYNKTQKLYPLKYPLDIIFWLSIITYFILGISTTIIGMFIIYYLIARGFLGNDNFSGGKGGGGSFGGGGFSGGGSFGGGSFGGGGAGR